MPHYIVCFMPCTRAGRGAAVFRLGSCSTACEMDWRALKLLTRARSYQVAVSQKITRLCFCNLTIVYRAMDHSLLWYVAPLDNEVSMRPMDKCILDASSANTGFPKVWRSAAPYYVGAHFYIGTHKVLR